MIYLSFSSVDRKNGEVVLGKIVVHDRVKVESSILPRYFNHSSFASLRRQLNYFSFTRIGKGRQRGATYCNEGVVELNDILTLKRRSVVNQGAAPTSFVNSAIDLQNQTAAKVEKAKTGSKGSATGNKGPGDRRPSTKKGKDLVTSSKRNSNKRHRISITGEHHQTPLVAPGVLPPRVSPVDHLVGGDEVGPPAKRISLDLTAFSSPESIQSFVSVSGGPPSTIYTDSSSMGMSASSVGFGDDDILAGCRALLCFSRGTRGISSR